jgi:hypothetical protein
MGLLVKARHLPVRTAIGAFMLSDGLDKPSADADEVGHLHGLAAGAYPVVKDVDPARVVKTVSAGEIRQQRDTRLRRVFASTATPVG